MHYMHLCMLNKIPRISAVSQLLKAGDMHFFHSVCLMLGFTWWSSHEHHCFYCILDFSLLVQCLFFAYHLNQITLLGSLCFIVSTDIASFFLLLFNIYDWCSAWVLSCLWLMELLRMLLPANSHVVLLLPFLHFVYLSLTWRRDVLYKTDEMTSNSLILR